MAGVPCSGGRQRERKERERREEGSERERRERHECLAHSGVSAPKK